MWLITPDGFFSVVQKPGDAQHQQLTVRARVASDLDRLRDTYLPELGQTVTGAGTDYAYRATAPREAVAAAMARIASAIDYANFKDEVKHRQGWSRANAYHHVWHALYALQDGAR